MVTSLLPLAVLVALNCLHERTPEQLRVWTRTGISFALVYLALVGFVYIIQLALVTPARFAGTGAAVEELFLSAAWIQAVDSVGYALMSVAFLCAAGALRGRGERSARRWFLAHGGPGPGGHRPVVGAAADRGRHAVVRHRPGVLCQLTRLFPTPFPESRS